MHEPEPEDDPTMSELEIPDALQGELRAAWHRYLDMVAPFRPALHAYCRRLTRDVWDAEDLSQDALMKAFGTLGHMNEHVRNPRAYLLRIATNLWIDTLRRRETESKLLAAAEPPQAPRQSDRVAIGEAGARLMERLAPRERAAVVLKDVFEMSLEETAEVLQTTVGAIKSALHRGRERLRASEEEVTVERATPNPAFVDRFVELFNRGDKAALLELVVDNATAENVGCGYGYGADTHRGRHSWFEGALGGHPEWPEVWHYESQRAERAVYRGESIVLLFRTRRGREALEGVVRLEEEDGRVTRLRSYGFCPETQQVVADELGLRLRSANLYRYPTPEPGRTYQDTDER